MPRLVDASTPALLERAEELKLLQDSIDASAAGQGRLVVIEGEPGIGKSSLMRAALGLAARGGMRVLQATGGELERMYPYGIALDLFGRTVATDPERGELLSGAAGRVLPLLSGESLPGDLDASDPFPVVHGFYWLIANVAERDGLLLAVDDAHWADVPSLRVLSYLAQRLGGMRVLLLVAAWPQEVAEPAEMRSLRAAATTTLRPAPLSAEAVRNTLVEAGHVADDRFVAACRHATGGNPFFLRELLGQLQPTTDAGQVGELAPDEIVHRVEQRLSAFGADAVEVARAVALLGTEATLGSVAACVGASLGDVAAVVDRLAGGRVLVGGDPVSFVHPIVRSAVYDSIPAQERAVAHRRAADVLAAGPSPPLDAIATHLRAAPRSGDQAVVELLHRAARAAAGRGDSATAADDLRRALDEPPGPGRRREILIDLGRAMARIGDSQAAADALREARRLSANGTARAAIAAEEGEVLQAAGQFAEAAAAFDAGLDERVDELGLLDRLLAGSLASAEFDRAHGSDVVARAERVLGERGGPERLPLVALWVAHRRSLAATGSRDIPLALVRNVLDRVPLPVLQAMGGAVELAHATLLSTDELDADRVLLTRAMGEAQRSGSHAKYAVASYCRAWPNLHTGRLTEALADAQAAIDSLEAGWEMFYPAARAVLALAHAERNDLDAAREAIDLDESRWGQRMDYRVLVPSVRARLLLAEGNAPDALALLEAQEAAAAELGVPTPALSPWRSWLVTALVASGQAERGRRLAEEQLAVARTWGAGRQVAAALRGLGMAVGGPEGLKVLREAREIAARSPARLEQLRIGVDLGVALRVTGARAEARQTLAAAADLAHQLGAAALAARALDELRVLGARPRRVALTGPAALTPSELRVVELVVAGRSNREVAQALFVTLKAVEYHLANAYAKLGISSRRDLPRVLGTVAGSASEV